MKVLVIDDEQDVGMDICKTLSENGVDSFLTDNLSDGFKIIDREKIDAVLTDLNMPIDGFQVVKSIRDKNKTIPILLYSRTIFLSKEAEEIALEFGATFYQAGSTIQSLLDAVKNKLSMALYGNSEATKNFLNSI